MKIRTDFVTNSSSSSFSVLITLTGTNGQNTQLYENSSEYCEEFSQLDFNGNPKKLALGFDSVEKLCRYLADSINNDFDVHDYSNDDKNEIPDFFQDRADAFVQESVRTFHSVSDIAKIEIEYDAFATGEGYNSVADADLYKMTIDMKKKSCIVLHHSYKDPYADMDECDEDEYDEDEYDEEWGDDEIEEEWEETISWDKNDRWTEEDEKNELLNNDYNDESYYIFDDAMDDEDEDIGVYQFNDIPVVGTQYENRNERIEKVRVGDPVELVREPDNQYDFNAILVRTCDGSLGYISAEDNSFIAPLLDSGEFTCEAEVTTVIPLSKRSEKCRASILKISFQLIRK